ncbi:MAG: SAM-dependent methyltransferase [Phenylobacterium sp.]|nr:SAM-dependent methyltransferase [Phenylobacterium sp.]
MRAIDPDGFEAMFRKDTDPWNYAGSPFEAFKRRELLRACGGRLYGRGLELACANGETSRLLASRCLHLLAVDSSPTVIAAAQAGVAEARVEFAVARLPDETPRGPFDLIVASEILYYLPRDKMADLLRRLDSALAPAGRIVLLHHTIRFADAAQAPRKAQDDACDHFRRTMRQAVQRRFRRFQVAAFDKPQGR